MSGFGAERVWRFVEQLRGLRVHTPHIKKVYDLEPGMVGGTGTAQECWGWIIHVSSFVSIPPVFLGEAQVTLVGGGREVEAQPLRILGDNMLLVVAPKISPHPPLQQVEGVWIRIGERQRWFENSTL